MAWGGCGMCRGLGWMVVSCRSAPSAAILAAFVLVLAGCGHAAPEVTFSVADRSVQTEPIRYCDIDLAECEQDDAAVAVLDVPAGYPVHISVPDAVAETPWQVVFRYRKDGEQLGGRSTVFTPGTQREYILRAPEGATLETLEVQQYGVPVLEEGKPSFPIRAAWVLTNESG